MKRILIRFFLACLLVPSATYAIPTNLLINSSGQLTGADGVHVDGTEYQVRFVEGSYDSLFPSSLPAFMSVIDAETATQALLGQVLGSYMDTPSSIIGCASTVFCEVATWMARPNPDAIVNVSIAGISTARGFGAGWYDGTWDKGANTALLDTAVVAIWSPQTAAVPEPSTLVLLSLSVASLGFVRRRKLKEPSASFIT